MFSAIVPKTSKFIQKSLSFQDFLSETLLCKCFSGHVKSRFDNAAKNFPLKIQVFLVESKNDNKSSVQDLFLLTFFFYTFRLLFRHTWLFFLSESEKKHI